MYFLVFVFNVYFSVKNVPHSLRFTTLLLKNIFQVSLFILFIYVSCNILLLEYYNLQYQRISAPFIKQKMDLNIYILFAIHKGLFCQINIGFMFYMFHYFLYNFK